MSKLGTSTHKKVFKRTRQGGSKPKTSAMTRTQKRTYKAYRGQGR